MFSSIIGCFFKTVLPFFLNNRLWFCFSLLLLLARNFKDGWSQPELQAQFHGEYMTIGPNRCLWHHFLSQRWVLTYFWTIGHDELPAEGLLELVLPTVLNGAIQKEITLFFCKTFSCLHVMPGALVVIVWRQGDSMRRLSCTQ